MSFDWESGRMGAGLLLLACSAAASAGLILLLRPWLRAYALARPNARSSHHMPTPQGGGIAVIAATIGATLLADAAMAGDAMVVSAYWVPLAAAAFIATVGAVDDIRTIEVGPRLLLQALAVAAVVFTLPAEARIVPALPLLVERSLLIVAGLWAVNLTNFMDGIDWMTVAEVLPVSGSIVIIGLLVELPLFAVVIALALAGAMLGFAPFNRPVARLFLGDVGSLPIGLLLGWLLLLIAARGYLTAAIILPLYYVADATITLCRRVFAGERFWLAHRTHFYQRAIEKGFTVSEITARVFVVNIILAALAVWSVLRPGISPIALAAAVVLVGGLLWMLSRPRR